MRGQNLHFINKMGEVWTISDRETPEKKWRLIGECDERDEITSMVRTDVFCYPMNIIDIKENIIEVILRPFEWEKK